MVTKSFRYRDSSGQVVGVYQMSVNKEEDTRIYVNGNKVYYNELDRELQ